MGLDVSGKKDYFRFNWTAVTSLRKWCKEHNLPSPFGNKWDDCNDGDDYLHDLRQWTIAFKKMFPDQCRFGPGQAIRDTQFATWAIAEKEMKGDNTYKPEYVDWQLWTATAWYYFLKNQFKVKGYAKFG